MARKLLLVIDLQEGWRHNTATEKAMLNTVRLATNFPGKIIHCCFRNDPDSLFYKQMNWKRFSDSPDIDIIPEALGLNMPVYWRSTYSCLTDEVKTVVHDFDEVYVAGVFTDISVSATVMALFDEGIRVKVVRDCLATLHGQAVHQAALVSLSFMVGNRNIVESKELFAA